MIKTLIIGASPHSWRFSYKAAQLLASMDLPFEQLGKSAGTAAGKLIDTEPKPYEDIHTVTLYLRPEIQREVEAYILDLRPARVIFNPGSENPYFGQKLKDAGIEVVEACTLVMLRAGQYID